jgi:pyruvate/2-oxoglutarate dehydrogenase complex dihydrolipoamide dehydrogenase (E3) component
MNAKLLRPDLCVIGAGAGGLSVAAAAAAMGAPVVLVEKGAMGGDCLNFGCVPSKALIAAGQAAQAMRAANRFGLEPVEPRVDPVALHAHVHGVISGIAPTDSSARFEALGVQVIRAAGRFVSRDMLEAGEYRIKARRFVIATGSSPSIPRIPGLETVRFLTNETLFDLKTSPEHLIVVGAGAIGVEIAQAWRRLGAKVTLLEAGRALGREDPELAAVVIDQLANEGVDMREGASVARVEPLGDGVRVFVERDGSVSAIDGSHLLIATGRAPNVDGLGLEAAGVDFDRDGVRTGANLRTTNRRVYAVGDVVVAAAGGARFTHAANYHAGLVLRATLFRLPVRVAPGLVPRVTYSDPEIASVGLDETAARERGLNPLILRWPFAENDRARAERDTRGHIKVIATRRGRILGAGIVGPRAGELIAPWQLALTRKLSIGDMAGVIMPYPTLSEVSRRAAVTGLARGLRNPWLGRALRFLRRFG